MSVQTLKYLASKGFESIEALFQAVDDFLAVDQLDEPEAAESEFTFEHKLATLSSYYQVDTSVISDIIEQDKDLFSIFDIGKISGDQHEFSPVTPLNYQDDVPWGRKPWRKLPAFPGCLSWCKNPAEVIYPNHSAMMEVFDFSPDNPFTALRAGLPGNDKGRSGVQDLVTQIDAHAQRDKEAKSVWEGNIEAAVITAQAEKDSNDVLRDRDDFGSSVLDDGLNEGLKAGSSILRTGLGEGFSDDHPIGKENARSHRIHTQQIFVKNRPHEAYSCTQPHDFEHHNFEFWGFEPYGFEHDNSAHQDLEDNTVDDNISQTADKGCESFEAHATPQHIDSEKDNETKSDKFAASSFDETASSCQACNSPDDDLMVACENDRNHMDGDCWYHYSCIGLTPQTLPADQWYCPPCRSESLKAAVIDTHKYVKKPKTTMGQAIRDRFRAKNSQEKEQEPSKEPLRCDCKDSKSKTAKEPVRVFGVIFPFLSTYWEL